jgi:maltose O-acetyltransferase
MSRPAVGFAVPRVASAGADFADDPELAGQNALAMDLMAAFNATGARQAPLRRHLLEQLLGSVGEGTEIRPPLYVDYGAHITIGARSFANFGLVALDVAAITIGDDVEIGPNVQLLTPTHPAEPEPRRQKWEAARPITIGDNVWLGGAVIVCPGVSIGANTVVGAGAVVTRDLPADVVAVGNPARVIRTLGPERGLAASRGGADVQPFALWPEQAEHLGRLVARAECVRHVGVELRDLAGRQGHVVLAE